MITCPPGCVVCARERNRAFELLDESLGDYSERVRAGFALVGLAWSLRLLIERADAWCRGYEFREECR